MEKLLLIGLGNTPDRYQDTRHNLGIEVLRQWVLAHSPNAGATNPWKKTDTAAYASVTIPRDAGNACIVHCLFPLTMMNNSGAAVAGYMHHHGLTPDQALILHDDVELPLGSIKLVGGGSAKGHNGVRSIHEHLATTDIARLRLGVGRPSDDYPLDKYVLESFTAEELPAVNVVIKQAMTMLNDIAQQGLPAFRV